MSRIAFSAVLGVLATAVSACDSVADSPTKPSSGLMVQHTSSVTQLEAIAIRVQLRLRVIQGLDGLGDGVTAGVAEAEVCIDDSCASEPLALGPVDAECDTAVGFGSVELAAVWLEGEEVGIDFCVPITTNTEVYRTTVSDGQRQSNVVETACGQDGGSLTCAAN